MINYKLLEFAAPPCTKENWYVKSFQLLGLGPGTVSNAHSAWDHGDKHRLLRLTLVRNPIDWLVAFYQAVRTGKSKELNGTFGPLATLNFSSIDGFFDSYLHKAQGCVTSLFNNFEADIVHKSEDAPYALMDFTDTLEIPKIMSNQLLKIKLCCTNEEPISISPWVRTEIKKSEQEIFDRYDYW